MSRTTTTSAGEADSTRALVLALEAELAAAAQAATDVATVHQREIDRLQRDLVEAKLAVVAVQESWSWRITRPLRATRRVLAVRRRPR